MPDVLVVDDDASLRRILEYNLEREGYAVASASTGMEALAKLKSKKFDLVLTDIKMPGMDGMDLLKKIRSNHPEVQVIVITAFGTIEMAVEAMKAGAFEYVTKPYNRDELKISVAKALRVKGLEEENTRLKKELSSKYGFENMIGDSPAMQKVFRIIEKVAETDAPVLITGESGAGKELVAKAIHYRGMGADRPFVAVNCAAIPKDLLESELFGHKKGAFTGAIKDRAGKFEIASGGTLFLDEIGDLPFELQAKILRAVQEMEITPVGSEKEVKVNVRIISATNKNLDKAVNDESFREDLYYRLAVVPVRVPSLRERTEDIPLLVSHFMKSFCPGKDLAVSKDAMQLLLAHPWKGNIRELENVVKRTVVLRESDKIEVADLPDEIRNAASLGAKGFSFTLPSEGIALTDIEREVIIEALKRTGWNQSRAAKLLKIPRHMLMYRLDKLNIPRKAPDST